MNIIIIFSLLSIAGAQIIGYQQKPLKVTVLYESLCPDSRRFMQNQLDQHYPLLKDYIDVQYVPFGKADSNDAGTEFTCQHGLHECQSNRIQSCAIDKAANQDVQTAFAICFMTTIRPGDDYWFEVADRCGKPVGIPRSEVHKCMNSDEGTQLQLRDEKITKSFYGPLRFVPTIVYDDQFDQKLQDRSLSDFKGVVCDLLYAKGVQDSHLNNVCSKIVYSAY